MFVHGHGFFLTMLAALFGTVGTLSDKSRRPEQPSGKHCALPQIPCPLSQKDKDSLREVLGAVRVVDTIRVWGRFENGANVTSRYFTEDCLIPEPGTGLLLSAGLLGLAAVRRRS